MYGKTSSALPLIFDELLQKYKIKTIYYARGPGSFMALKLQYIFFKTLQITKNIELKACDSFYFTQNSPVFATANLAFIKQDGAIVPKKLEPGEKMIIEIPQKIKAECFGNELSPLYILPAL